MICLGRKEKGCGYGQVIKASYSRKQICEIVEPIRCLKDGLMRRSRTNQTVQPTAMGMDGDKYTAAATIAQWGWTQKGT